MSVWEIGLIVAWAIFTVAAIYVYVFWDRLPKWLDK